MIMDDKMETQYQTVITRLQNDLLAAEMREKFYVETLGHHVRKTKELEDNAKRKETDGRTEAAAKD